MPEVVMPWEVPNRPEPGPELPQSQRQPQPVDASRGKKKEPEEDSPAQPQFPPEYHLG